MLECPQGYVATGSCSSREGEDCGYVQHYVNMLLCCKIRVDATQNVRGNINFSK